MRLYHDTETNGKATFAQPENFDIQPHMVQLGAILADETGKEMAAIDLLIKPDGWIITPELTEIHGITTEMCEKYGVPLKVACAVFNSMLRCADETVAHNDKFDSIIIAASYSRAGHDYNQHRKQPVCTMELMTPVMQLPAKWGSKYKWPTLQEAYERATGTPLVGGHQAIIDTRACKVIHEYWMGLPDE
jgi:DNA polymerase-3 subunit epsilon